MKLHIHFDLGETRVDEVVTGDTEEAVVAEIQKRVAQRAGFVVGVVVRAMTPLQFAQEVTKRYAVHSKQTIPLPATCAEFIQMAESRQFATRLEE